MAVVNAHPRKIYAAIAIIAGIIAFVLLRLLMQMNSG